MMIPPAVRTEIIERGKSEGYADAVILENLETEGWLRTTRLSHNSSKLAQQLSSAMGRGEAEAIALALERKERLFIDDLKGRRIAKMHSIETTTTLGLIFELLSNHVIPPIDYVRNVKNYGSKGWISGDVLEEFIKRGEDF